MIPVRIRVSMPLARSIKVEIGPGKGAHPMLGDDDFLSQRRDSGMDLRIFGTRGEYARGLKSVERCISVADLRMPGRKADDHVDPPHPDCARDGDQLRRPIEQRLRTGGIVVDDQRLEIHDEQRARPAIDRKIVCHCWSCSYKARGVTGCASITTICQVAGRNALSFELMFRVRLTSARYNLPNLASHSAIRSLS